MIIKIIFFLLLCGSVMAQDSVTVTKMVMKGDHVFSLEYKSKDSRKKVKPAIITVWAEQPKARRRVYTFKGLTTDNPDSLINKILP